MRRFVDAPVSSKVGRGPDQTSVVFEDRSDGDGDGGTRLRERGFAVSKIELCLYMIRTHEDLGPYSLITTVVHTDKGSIEMFYDEGFRGRDPLGKESRFLVNHLGILGVVHRSLVSLESALSHNA